MFSEEDINIQYNNFIGVINEKDEEDSKSSIHDLSNIKCESFLKTEPLELEDECGDVKIETDETTKELNIFLPNIKSEFEVEEIKIQYGVLDDQEGTRNSATVQTLYDASLLKIEPTIQSNNKLYECEFCNQYFNTKETLNIHREESYKCKNSVKKTQQSALNKINKTHMRKNTYKGEHTRENLNSDAKSFKCEICRQNFNHKQYLIVHMRIHTGEKPYKCKICGKRFTQKQNLNSHNMIHTGKKPFKCETCSKCFSQRQSLNKHMRIHTGENPFKCDTCNKSFRVKISLQKHTRNHTGEKPFKCGLCGIGCRDKGILKNHLRTHTGEKPFKCATCGKCYGSGHYLKRHMSIHADEKPFKCDTCGKSFINKGNLNIHMRNHGEEEPYKCEVCGQGFIQKFSLRNHINKEHANNHSQRKKKSWKLFKCQTCGKCFNKKLDLFVHMNIHLEMKPSN